MRLTQQQKNMLDSAKQKGRIYSIDTGSDCHSQSAWWRTARSLESKGLLKRARYSNGNLMDAMDSIRSEWAY